MIRLRNGDWLDAFDRLDAQGGGVIYVPPGVHETEPVTIDLADYPNVGNGLTVRGGGLGTSTVHLGVGPGDGLRIVDSGGGDYFYFEITGVQFRGARDGVLFQLGSGDAHDAYNSCTLAFATNNGSPDATAACRFDHVLNSRHFGVHNTDGGTALDLRRTQFGSVTGSTRSNRGVSLRLGEGSFANVVEWLNVEACHDGVLIDGSDANLNSFGLLYGAHVGGRLWRHEADVRSVIDVAFIGDGVATVDERTAGSYRVGASNQPFEDAESVGWPP